MHRNEYRRMAHEEVEEIFREILPQAGMKVREEQITLCHQMLSSLCGNKIALCDAAVFFENTVNCYLDIFLCAVRVSLL